jgi:hypothetical protein
LRLNLSMWILCVVHLLTASLSLIRLCCDLVLRVLLLWMKRYCSDDHVNDYVVWILLSRHVCRPEMRHSQQTDEQGKTIHSDIRWWHSRDRAQYHPWHTSIRTCTLLSS